jgi:hypothetical protein
LATSGVTTVGAGLWNAARGCWAYADIPVVRTNRVPNTGMRVLN